MSKKLRPYTIRDIESALVIKFDEVVTADTFFANCVDIQKCFERGIYHEIELSQVYLDFSATIWFDTLAMCYLLLFADIAKHRHALQFQFFFPEEIDTWRQTIFLSFLHDNGFLLQMREIGTVRNVGLVPEAVYSAIHKCVWPLQIFHKNSEAENNIELIKKQLHNELSGELNSYELEYTINRAIYFLRETLNNVYKHGYPNDKGDGPCALLIKRVKSGEGLDLKKYRVQYVDRTPYVNISLFEEKHGFLEIYVADVGVGLRHSFLEDPDGTDAQITDENILEYILSNGQRSRKKISARSSTQYGGLYDITVMFQEDGDALGFKGDSRWMFNKTPKRINLQVPQHEYQDLVHGFAVIGSISWKKRHSSDYPFREKILAAAKAYKKALYLEKNPQMRKGYCTNIQVQDYRFGELREMGGDPQILVLFPQKYFGKDDIINLLRNCKSSSVIISGIHESEYKKYKTTLESLTPQSVGAVFERAIIITNTLFAHVFIKRNNRIVYSEKDTEEYICGQPEGDINTDAKRPISVSYLSFRLWKKVYDSEQIWSCLAEHNSMGYINSEIQWHDTTLKGYLDFSQLCLISECRNLCIEQLMGFQLYHDHIYFRSLDRFTDEICELVNHRMDNARGGEVFWIGSVFVSGTSERKLSHTGRKDENVYYFFKHANCQTTDRDIYTIFEWATQTFRIDHWFDPKYYKGKSYSRVGNSSFVAEGGSNYWASRHYAHWNQTYSLRQEETYQVLQKQFGARPAVLKMGHFDSADHHDLFEIKTDSLVESDAIASQIIRDDSSTSYDFLLAEFLGALVSFSEKTDLDAHLSLRLSNHSKKIIQERCRNIGNTLFGMQGIIVYLNDYQTARIIESIKPLFAHELQQRIIPIIPIEKNYASSTLLISPLLLDALEQKMADIRKFNHNKFGRDEVNVTLFMAMSFTTRLQEELKHMMRCMGASQVFSLSVFDRQRLPYGSCLNTGNIAYARLDLPAIGFLDTCPICEALKTLGSLHLMLRDEPLIQRLKTICSHWEAVKSSDNHYENGISINRLLLPVDIEKKLREFQTIYKQGEINITTDLGLSLFAIESTVISLSLDFLDACILSEELDPEVKLLLISAHILTFNHLQLSEKHYCRLLDNLCDLLDEQEEVSQFTGLAVIALCGQPSIFRKYAQKHMLKRFFAGDDSKNNDGLILKIALYQTLRGTGDEEISPEYRRELQCYLKHGKNTLELIYDLFLYVETEYKQSHRQAFGQLSYTSIKMETEVYKRALQYTHKLKDIYRDDLLKSFFHDPSQYLLDKKPILDALQELESSLIDVENNEDHGKVRVALTRSLSMMQKINKGLYLRTQLAVGSKNISNWLDYCEICARKRFGQENDVILKIIAGHTYKDHGDPDVYPWFFVHADVTEEVINLIVDMMQGRFGKLRNFLQDNTETQGQAYDGIITVGFQREFVELSFYNATQNEKSIQEIRKIKKSKENRPSILTFRQFEHMLSDSKEERTFACFDWDYVEEQHQNYLANEVKQVVLGNSQNRMHLYRATVRIPYVDMGSSFGQP